MWKQKWRAVPLHLDTFNFDLFLFRNTGIRSKTAAKGGKRGEPKTKEETENVDVLCSLPSLIRHPLHQSRPPTLKKQNNVLTSWWRGAEGRADREGRKLGNQMWSIKTYWHAKGLPLPHSYTVSTNSYSRPRCMHVCMHKSHTGCTNPTDTFMHEFCEKYTTCKWPCVRDQSCKMIGPQKQTCKSYVCTCQLIFNKTCKKMGGKTCCGSGPWGRICINQCWPANILHKTQIYKWVVTHQCLDMHPISTCTQARQRLGERDGGVLFSSMGRAVFGGWSRGDGGGG